MNYKFLLVVLFSFGLLQASDGKRSYDQVQSSLQVFTSGETGISEETKMDHEIVQKIRKANEQSQVAYKQTLLTSWERLSSENNIIMNEECSRLRRVVCFLKQDGKSYYNSNDAAIVKQLNNIESLYSRTHSVWFYCLCENTSNFDFCCCCCFSCERNQIPIKSELQRERQLLVNALFDRLKTIQVQTPTTAESLLAIAVEMQSPSAPQAVVYPMEMARTDEI